VTGPDHYRMAERNAGWAKDKETGSDGERYHLAAAQVHATLALVAATAHAGITLTLPDGSDLAADWNRAIFNEEGVA